MQFPCNSNGRVEVAAPKGRSAHQLAWQRGERRTRCLTASNHPTQEGPSMAAGRRVMTTAIRRPASGSTSPHRRRAPHRPSASPQGDGLASPEYFAGARSADGAGDHRRPAASPHRTGKSAAWSNSALVHLGHRLPVVSRSSTVHRLPVCCVALVSVQASSGRQSHSRRRRRQGSPSAVSSSVKQAGGRGHLPESLWWSA